jgi:hypothetical protein
MHHATKSGGIAPPFLTSALDGGQWSASRPCRFPVVYNIWDCKGAVLYLKDLTICIWQVSDDFSFLAHFFIGIPTLLKFSFLNSHDSSANGEMTKVPKIVSVLFGTQMGMVTLITNSMELSLS